MSHLKQIISKKHTHLIHRKFFLNSPFDRLCQLEEISMDFSNWQKYDFQNTLAFLISTLFTLYTEKYVFT